MTETIYQYMASLGQEGTRASIDAVTITALGLGGKLTIGFILDKFADELLVEEEKPFRFNGAEGFSRGSLRYAAKWDNLRRQIWSILMVTGELSDRVFSEAAAYDTGDLRYTRIDLCVDVRLTENVKSLAEKIYNARRNMEDVSYISSFTGDTVYFGKRSSPAFARIYDKSLEYGESLGRIWRFELEAKKNLAHEIALELIEAKLSSNPGTEKDLIREIVWDRLRRMGAPTPKIDQHPDIVLVKATMSSNEMKLNWLKTRVSKTVRHLVAAGFAPEVSKALGVQIDLGLDKQEEEG